MNRVRETFDLFLSVFHVTSDLSGWGHFVTLTEVGMLLISCNPGNICVVGKVTKIAMQNPHCTAIESQTTIQTRPTETKLPTHFNKRLRLTPFCLRKLSAVARG